MKQWLKLSLALSCIAFMNSYTLADNESFSKSNKLLSKPAAVRNEQSLDRIIAIINKTVITQSELDDAMNRIKKQLLATHTPTPPTTILHKQVLDQLINRKLQLEMAEQTNIHVTEADITEAIHLVAKKNKITVEKLYASVAEQGLTKEEYRKEIHDEIAINRVQRQMMGNKISISPQEVDDFMRSAAWLSYNSKEYHLEDILIALPDKPTIKNITEAKARAEAVLTKLHQGVSFSEAAIADSSDSKALQGGDLGWRKLPEIPSAFASQLMKMKENDIAGPIQTPNGFHIIHVAGIRNIKMSGNKDEQRKQVEELLYERKYEEALQTWITKLRSESYINLNPKN